MKRYLLFVIAFVCVSIGAWAGAAEGFELKPDQIGTWFINTDASLGTEKVIKVEVSKTGGLKAALDELTAILNGQARPDYLNKLNEAANNSSNFVSEKKLVLQVVNTSGSALALSSDDILALASINIPTIDLQDLNPASTFTFVNPNVKRVILPDGWDKADVNAFGEALKTSTNFESAYSINATNGTDYTLDATSGSIVAYVNKPGTLYTAIRHIYGQHVVVNNKPVSHTKLGTADAYTFGLDKLKYFTLLGTPSAHDFNGGDAAAIKYDAEGHFVFDREADETKKDKDAGIGGTRQLLGTHKTGAIAGAQLAYLNLGDAIITDEHCSDLTISWSFSAQSTTLKWIVFPTTPLLKTLPADCLNGDYALLEEFCIPGNIEVLKTRACLISTRVLRHIWTTNPVSGDVIDNGAYTVHPTDRINPAVFDHYEHAPLTSDVWNCGREFKTGKDDNGDGTSGVSRYGTITLPQNLRLIESNNFTSQFISDVYSLNPVAPECHVDAFSTIMYLGNNHIDTQYINEMEMVTREAYAQDVAAGEYITFLHYPPTIGTPEIQRYTDPTREFSVATTLRDGKGNIIYFPNQSELNRAYVQGTTGYLWYAWDSERVPEPNGNANAFVTGSTAPDLNGHTTAIQQTANNLYIANKMTNPDKTDRSFYDVRLDGNGQPSLEKPADLDWYYNTVWEKKQLYPEMQSTNTDSILGYVQRVENGHLAYRPSTSGDECDFVQDYSYVQDNEGLLYWDRDVTENDNGNYVKDYECVEATDGEFYHPFVKETTKSDDKCNAGVYWYFKTDGSYTSDPNGNYINSNEFDEYQPDYYTTIDVLKGWGWSDEKIAGYTHYSAGGSWIHLTSTSQDNYIYYNTDVYYVSEGYAPYDASGVVAGANETRYRKVYSEEYRLYNASTDEGEQRYDVTDNGLRAYNSATDTDNSKRYTKQYKDFTYRAFNPSKDAADEPRYCPIMDEVHGITKNEYTADYRGWHQFVLAAYGPAGDPEEETVVKFYQTDRDWWTVCLPYDLTYSEMIRFFGNGPSNIPYLSKLRYVVRDYDQQKITLMFSKNLMVYKEDVAEGKVHGVIDDETTWPETNGEGLSIGTDGYDPVILHKGVPYLIRPNIDVKASRSFTVYKSQNADLYQRLVDAENVDGGALETYIYEGEYTVPAYVVGTTTEGTTTSRKLEDYSYTNTYTSDDEIMYRGQTITAPVSSEYSYTFVGSFFLSVLPQNCYFLGWDSNRNCAAFWYNVTPNLDDYEWNNQTGVICANFNNTTTLIHKATGLNDPARWKFTVSDGDDLKVASSAGAPKKYDMSYGGSINMAIDDPENPLAEDFGNQEVLSIDEIQSLDTKSVWYNVSGQKLNGRPTQSGVYIMNGKKYVVK